MIKYFRLISIALTCSYFWYYTQTYTEWHFIDNVNLIFHEAGHAIFFWLPEFWNIAAGSIIQVSLPLFIALYFLTKGQKISSALGLLWVGQNLLNVSIYAGDAINQALPLLGGDSVIHDWNYLLSMSGMISKTDTAAQVIYTFGIILLMIGGALALYYSWTKDTTALQRVI